MFIIDKLVNISVLQFMVYVYSYKMFESNEYYHYSEPGGYKWMMYKKCFKSGVINFHNLLTTGIKL